MVAEKDPHIAGAAKTLYRASADERVRALCEGRERGELTVRTLQLELQQKDAQLSAALARIAELEAAQKK